MNGLFIVKLSDNFYKEHIHDKEVLNKKDRPYVQGTLLSDNKNLYFVPFRTQLPLKAVNLFPEAFIKLPASSKPNAGLDITKTVLISSPENVEILPKAYIEKEQYRLLLQKESELWGKVKNYVQEYQRTVRQGKELSAKYQYTALRYFHKELNLPNKMPGIKKNTPTRNYHDPNFVPPLKNNKSIDRRI
ncbi:hypothetical protein AB9M75_06065 [Lactobacillus sp. AN1001]